jgi:hypothetical protein
MKELAINTVDTDRRAPAIRFCRSGNIILWRRPGSGPRPIQQIRVLDGLFKMNRRPAS